MRVSSHTRESIWCASVLRMGAQGPGRLRAELQLQLQLQLPTNERGLWFSFDASGA